MEPKTNSELIGVVEGITFKSDTSAFTIFRISSSAKIHTAVGDMPQDLAPGQNVVLRGQWVVNPSYGRQFRVQSFERTMPENSFQYLKYLSSGAIRGIGPRTAEQIVSKFGDETFDVLENHPERLAGLKGISEKKAEDIARQFKEKKDLSSVSLKLEKLGLTAKESVELYRLYGDNAPDYVEANPYLLTTRLASVTFARADKIAADMGLAPDNVFRLQAGILNELNNAMYREGHTCLTRKRLVESASAKLGCGEDAISDCVDDMISGFVLSRYDAGDETFIATAETFGDEKNIASRIRTLVSFSQGAEEATDEEIDLIERKFGIRYADKQREAIRLASYCGVLILTGGPGTGKTTTVNGIINYFDRKKFKVSLAAPTGRAAKRMTELTGKDAKTIHRLLEVEWEDEASAPSFRRDMEHPLECDVLIVDEISMCDVQLFSSLISAVRFGCRLILVGDSDQLPAVGPGNVLSDLLESGVVPSVELTEIFRQAQESMIITNAHRLIRGEEPELDDHSRDFFFLPRPDATAALAEVLSLVSERLRNAYGFSPTEDIQVLCPGKQGVCGSRSLNAQLQAIINPPDKNKGELKRFDFVFREGDKVMQTRNNYTLGWVAGAREGEGVFNGEIGYITGVAPAGGLTVRFDDGKVTEYEGETLSDLELAYAVTVHKSQGSEYTAVVIPVIDASPYLLYRNLLYTAVTRAKKLLILVGSREKILYMAANERKNRRYSLLLKLLNGT